MIGGGLCPPETLFGKQDLPSALVAEGRARGRGQQAPSASERSERQRTWMPHSLFSGFSHHHRPARACSPGATARVQGAQPIDG